MKRSRFGGTAERPRMRRGRAGIAAPAALAVLLSGGGWLAGAGCSGGLGGGASGGASMPPWDATSASLLLPRGSLWRYLDDGSDQGEGWRAEGYDDTGWK